MKRCHGKLTGEAPSDRSPTPQKQMAFWVICHCLITGPHRQRQVGGGRLGRRQCYTYRHICVYREGGRGGRVPAYRVGGFSTEGPTLPQAPHSCVQPHFLFLFGAATSFTVVVQSEKASVTSVTFGRFALRPDAARLREAAASVHPEQRKEGNRNER